MKNILKSKYGKIYWGLGPRIGYDWGKNTNNYSHENVKNNYSHFSSGFSIGLVTLIGIRSHITQSISLFAEAQLSGSKTWNKTEYESNYTNVNSYSENSQTSYSNGWGYSLVYSRIGLRFSL